MPRHVSLAAREAVNPHAQAPGMSGRILSKSRRPKQMTGPMVDGNLHSAPRRISRTA